MTLQEFILLCVGVYLLLGLIIYLTSFYGERHSHSPLEIFVAMLISVPVMVIVIYENYKQKIQKGK